MLSGEGLISMMSNDLLASLLPEKIKSPLGLGLVIVMAVRIAMVPGLYGQRAGTLCDQSACAELRSMFESQTPPVTMRDDRWAIDIATSLAQSKAKSKFKRGGTASELQLNDQLVYWHRVGQSIISSLFGLHTSFDVCLPTKHGSPWRFSDPLISARDSKLVEMGANYNHIREPPRISFATVSKKRVVLIKLLIDTEKYLRTGMFEGVRLMPKNKSFEEAKLPSIPQYKSNELFFPHIKSELGKGEKGKIMSEEEFHKSMLENFNTASVNQAGEDMAEALFAGPAVHQKHKMGCYLVSDSQRSPCADCGQLVHVLQGISMAFAFGECLNCHAKRCLTCSEKYNVDEMIQKRSRAMRGEQVEYSKKCTSCGHVQVGFNTD
jgi:hypothetical protein